MRQLGHGSVRPVHGAFHTYGTMTFPRTKFGGALLPDGRVLIAGGQVGGAWGTRTTSTQIYDPRTGRFAPGPQLNEDRFKLSNAVVSLKDGRVLIAGGAERPGSTIRTQGHSFQWEVRRWTDSASPQPHCSAMAESC